MGKPLDLIIREHVGILGVEIAGVRAFVPPKLTIAQTPVESELRDRNDAGGCFEIVMIGWAIYGRPIGLRTVLDRSTGGRAVRSCRARCQNGTFADCRTAQRAQGRCADNGSDEQITGQARRWARTGGHIQTTAQSTTGFRTQTGNDYRRRFHLALTEPLNRTAMVERLG